VDIKPHSIVRLILRSRAGTEKQIEIPAMVAYKTEEGLGLAFDRFERDVLALAGVQSA
jgi:hypothetical protein